MNLNKKGHGMSVPLWFVYLLQLWVILTEPFFELSKMTNKTFAHVAAGFVLVLQVFCVYKWGWKSLIPILSYIIWGFYNVN